MKLSAHDFAVMSLSGMASKCRVTLQIAVSKYVYPSLAGSGPTRSKWTWANRSSEVENLRMGATCAVVLLLLGTECRL